MNTLLMNIATVKKTRGKKRKICMIPLIYYDFKEKLCENIMNHDFLMSHNSKLFANLSKIFRERRESICCFLHEKYSYSVTTRSGGVNYVSFSEMMQREENQKIKEIKKTIHKKFPQPF